MNEIQLDKFKQEIAAVYNRRQDSYDRGGDNWHFKLACRLVEYAELQNEQRVLDLATGTVMVAIEAAKKVGSSGKSISLRTFNSLGRSAVYLSNHRLTPSLLTPCFD